MQCVHKTLKLSGTMKPLLLTLSLITFMLAMPTRALPETLRLTTPFYLTRTHEVPETHRHHNVSELIRQYRKKIAPNPVQIVSATGAGTVLALWILVIHLIVT